MNIFVLDRDPEIAAKYHCNKHVVKMILESSQMLCNTLHHTGQKAPYRSVHMNHPCSVWTRESLSNWHWLKNLVLHLNREFKYRFTGKDHQSYVVAMNLDIPDIEDKGITIRPQCVNEEYKRDDPITAYRLYYARSKNHLHKWTKRDVPKFIKTFT